MSPDIDRAEKTGDWDSNICDIGSAENILQFGMKWVFLRRTCIAVFFKSDNPTRLLSPNAKPSINFCKLNKELEISIPISSTFILWMLSRDIIQNPDIEYNQVLEVDNNKVDNLIGEYYPL